jgi:hypothetical protein
MEQNPSWEVNSYSTSREILHLLRNPKVHSRVQKNPPTIAPILMQTNPLSQPSTLNIISHLRPDLRSGLFPTGFAAKILNTINGLPPTGLFNR